MIVGTTLPVPAQSPGVSAIDMSVRSSSSTSTELQSDYKCMLCNESFYSESYLQQHIVQCNGSNSRPGKHYSYSIIRLALSETTNMQWHSLRAILNSKVYRIMGRRGNFVRNTKDIVKDICKF